LPLTVWYIMCVTELFLLDPVNTKFANILITPIYIQTDIPTLFVTYSGFHLATDFFPAETFGWY
jgi:hypothetical protein